MFESLFRPITEEYALAVALPSNIVPLPGSSKPIERLLSKREKEHKATLEALKLKCRQFNAQIEEEMKIEGDFLKENLLKLKNQIQQETSILFKHFDEDELANLNYGVIQTMTETVQNCNNYRLEVIDQFYEKLQELEKKRLNCFKKALNEAYKTSGKISHLLPYDLAFYFDTEIQKINEISMSNYAHYAKIHADLKLQVEEEIRVMLLNLQDFKENYKEAFTKVRLREIKGAYIKHDPSYLEPKLPVLTLGDADYASAIPRTSTDLEQWSKKMQMTLESLDVNAKKLIGLYKVAVVHIFNRFFDELNILKNALTQEDEDIENVLNMDYINSEIYKSIVVDVAELYTCDVAELQNLWNNITEYMETNIKNTYTFLKGSAHLWDNHFARTDEAKTLILRDLKYLIEKHDRAAQTFERKINNSLDKLREGSTVAKLDKHLKDINKFLDSIGKQYTKQCDDEIKLLKKYRNLIDQGIELLISEIDRFLTENEASAPIQQRKSWESLHDSTLTDHTHSDQADASVDVTEDLIPYRMKACQYQVDAVNNWMFGLWEAIKLYMTTCRSEQSEQADYWMNNISTKLRKRLEVRQATLKPRYRRVKRSIYDVRLKELEDHLNMMQNLENRVQQYITDSHNANQSSKEKRLEIIEDFEAKMRDIEQKLKDATKSLHVAACIEQVKEIADEVIDKFEETFKENYSVLEENRNHINELICHFGTTIKLFLEGGNYSRDEAKIFKKKLQKLRKGVPKKYKKVLRVYEASKPEILHTFKQTQAAIMQRLQLSKKEFEHNEHVCEKIKDLRESIRKFAYEIKFKIHRVDACIDYFADMSKMEIWKRKHFDIMKDAVQECVEKIIELSDFLIGDKNGYLFQLNQLIDHSYKEIEDVTKGFYGTHGPIINKGKIQPTFMDFMKEVGKNYEGFQKQVEIHCLECVETLIKHILKLLKVCDDVVESLMKKCPDLKLNHDVIEEGNELSNKLSKESVDLEERKMYLVGSQSEESVKQGCNSAVKDIILKNDDRVMALQFTIMKLLDHLRVKLNIAESIVEEGEEEDIDSLQFYLDFINKKI